jgi:hypothetical protein
MDLKTLEKILDYLPVIVGTCDRYGWLGGQGSPVPKSAIPDTRLFFDMLATKISLKEIPDLEDVNGSVYGGISLLWETELDPIKYTFDSFEIILYGDGQINYTANLESIGIYTRGGLILSEGLDPEIIQSIKFFKRKQNEQREIQKSSAPKSFANECMQ